MSGLFEHLAAYDEGAQIARRKAAAVAHKRVDDYVGPFIRAARSDDEREARLSLVEDDVQRIVTEVVDEYGGDYEHIHASITEHLADDDDSDDEEKDESKDDKPDFKPKDKGEDKGEEKEEDDDADDGDDNLPPWLKKDDKESKVANPESINVEPDWEGVRAWVLNLAKTDPQKAQEVAAAMGDEAPRELLEAPLPPGDMHDPYPQDYPDPGFDEPTYTASVHEARRPKMCPYHSELVDASLQAQDPQYGAFSGLVGGPSHCKGGFEGSCNFRPEMVTQSYWDKKDEEYAERKQEREQEQQRLQNPTPIEPIPTPDIAPIDDQGQGVTDINTELEEAPSAISQESDLAMAASIREADADRDGGGAVKTEDLPSADESGLGGPSPKIDKRKWTEENLDDTPGDAEFSGSPVPTNEIDVTEAIERDNKSDFHEQIDTVTEKQDLPTADEDAENTTRNIEQPHTDTFNNRNQADPVTSAIDPDKNPVREILNQDFIGDNQVEAAISEYENDAQK